jgi:Holliday junction resolvase RusA-like endonuclease
MNGLDRRLCRVIPPGMMLRLVILGQPTSKKNSMQLVRVRGRGLPLPSKKYREWMRASKTQVFAVTAGISGLPITSPVHLKILAYRHTYRKIDLSNIYAAVEDMLQEYGVLADDALVESHDGSRKFLGVPEDEARVEIELEELG